MSFTQEASPVHWPKMPLAEGLSGGMIGAGGPVGFAAVVVVAGLLKNVTPSSSSVASNS
jgi:hypothetical protein